MTYFVFVLHKITTHSQSVSMLFARGQQRCDPWLSVYWSNLLFVIDEPCAVDQLETLNAELSSVHQRTAETEQRLSDADENLSKKDQLM